MSHRKFTLEFKKQAVELAENLGSVSQAAQQLGISCVNVYLWKKKLNESEACKPSSKEELENEIMRLRQKNAELEKVNYILKGAAAFFSQDHLK